MEFDMPKDLSSIIKVIGVGGGGSNAVNYMYQQGIQGVDFVVCNTDKQALDASSVPLKIQIGETLTEGRGAGSIPEIGREAAEESIQEIKNFLQENTKMVFITAGMGGGTGTGAAPIIATAAKELGILTVGIVTIPFAFEGRKRRQQAEAGLEKIRSQVDTLLVINNEKLREMAGNLAVTQAFAMADEVLATAAKSIAQVISSTGVINVDFNDVKTVMKDSGVAIMGYGVSEGENRAIECVEKAMQSPLLNDNDITGANYVLLNITYGDTEVTMDEISTITDFVQDQAGNTAEVIFGHGFDPELGNQLGVTLIATGFKSEPFTDIESPRAANRVVLEPESKKEIVKPLATPTDESNEPFIKQAPMVNEVPKEVSVSAPEFTFEINNKTEEQPFIFEKQATTPESKEETTMPTPSSIVKEESTSVQHVYNLDDELNAEIKPATAPIEEKKIVNEHHEEISLENKERIAKDRLESIRKITESFRNPENIRRYESEPAYKRQNIEFDSEKPSSEMNTSHFAIDKNDRLNGNNSFLHDNVD